MDRLALVSDLTNRLPGRFHLELILWAWVNSQPLSRSKVKEWFRLMGIKGE